MTRFKTPTPEQEQEWATWVAGRPEAIRAVASRFEPWTLYRLKTTNQRVFIISFSESANGKVTCKVGVTGEFNLLTHERAVFGIDPDDLVECDLPGPDERLGSLDVPIDVLKPLMVKYPTGFPPHVMTDLIAMYPLRRSNND